MPANREAALRIAKARAPVGDVGMTEIAMLSLALIEADEEIERLRRCLESRDAFLVSRGIFSEYVATLPTSER